MNQSAVPQGGMSHAQFDYGATPSVFFGRTGWGPLIICLDTNLLIHLAQNHDEIGGSFGFDGQGFCPELWDDPVRALHDLFLLWFWRDVRFFLPPEQMKDGRLTADRARSRKSILDAFAQDFWQRGGFSRSSHVDGEAIAGGLDLVIPDAWPPSFDNALPPGMDGVLVRAAVNAGAHVFLTTDGRDILRRARDMARFSFAIMRPDQLLSVLNSSGALTLAPPDEALIPDLQSLAHFYAVFPQAESD
jgi:hypothetical protein